MNLKRYYGVLLGLILFNLLYGPLVRATDSGLACPDWPLCHGKFVPEWTFQIFMEVGHRYYSGLIGILVAGGFLWIWLSAERRKKFGLLSFVSLVFLMSQVTLGALTVTKLLDPTTVNLHLLNAILLATTCLFLRLLASETEESRWDWNKPGKFALWFALGIVAYQLFLGGKVSSNYAGLACPDFPTCYGSWFPTWEGTIRYQMEHRYFGYFVLVVVLLVSAYGILTWENKKAKTMLKWTAYLLSFQVFLGALNVIYHIPKLLTALHTLNAAFIFLSLSLATFYYFRIPSRVE